MVWNTTDNTVATVDSTGMAMTYTPGIAVIRAVKERVSSNNAELKVNSPVLTSLTLSPLSPTILAGGSKLFRVTGLYSDQSIAELTSSVTWTSSDQSVAAMSQTAPGPGECLQCGQDHHYRRRRERHYREH